MAIQKFFSYQDARSLSVTFFFDGITKFEIVNLSQAMATTDIFNDSFTQDVENYFNNTSINDSSSDSLFQYLNEVSFCDDDAETKTTKPTTLQKTTGIFGLQLLVSISLNFDSKRLFDLRGSFISGFMRIKFLTVLKVCFLPNFPAYLKTQYFHQFLKIKHFILKNLLLLLKIQVLLKIQALLNPI